MRLARRASFVMLVLLVLCAVTSAQSMRPSDDPRNTAPTVGTGGPPGGPTGLFTIYDGQTLRKGEFTFSIAYSNFDRDPGDVDIVETPLSLQIGVTNHLELFFSTNGYRGVKVNNPKNLSSFYLPNSQLWIRAPVLTPSTNPLGGPSVFSFGPLLLQSGPAIVLSPDRVSGAVLFPTNVAIFRQTGNQPFLQFPFVGGPGPNFGLTGNRIAPPFTSRIGGPTRLNNNFGAAANFPGIGSVFGSILPGIVLTQRVIPANLTFNTLVVPDLFTLMPSYLPDAPFINRLYGESAFGTFNIGAKWRWTENDNPLGVGIIPFYRYHPDHANDLSGFNQLQRGASPGGNLGDFGLIGFVDGRLSKHVNLSANIGYILNSNPRGNFGGTEATMLDRGDELLAGLGIDVPINKHFQWIAELKSVQYVGGRTPNAFPNNPVDFLTGIRIFPRRWFGLSAWYRNHLNQQGDRLFGLFDQDFPRGFTPSEDPNGFGFQFFIGHRNARAPITVENHPPTVTVTASQARVTLAAQCPPDQMPNPNCTPTGTTVTLTANATDPDGDTLLYTWTTTGGRITGDGPNVTWDLSGVAPGTYTASVEVDDGCGCISFSSTTVTVDRCDCVAIPTPTPIMETPTPTPSPTPPPPISSQQFDTYGNIPRNDVKARLDNFANELQNQPGSQGYIIAYGGRRGPAGEAQRRADFAKDYLVNTRGIDAGRLVTIDGGFKEEATTELWIVPTGATPPTASPTVDASEVKTTRPPTRRRGTRRRRDDDE
ncbi:MAG: PKD domain-containing protein [Acidobacteria bacterium]|nr:PKD domain-containing protein [Acidobacteriota bacterium]